MNPSPIKNHLKKKNKTKKTKKQKKQKINANLISKPQKQKKISTLDIRRRRNPPILLQNPQRQMERNNITHSKPKPFLMRVTYSEAPS